MTASMNRDIQSSAPPPPLLLPVLLPPLGGGEAGGAVTVIVCSVCCVSRGNRPTQSRLYLNEPTVVAVIVFEPRGKSTDPDQFVPSAPPPDAVHVEAPSMVQ